MVLDHQYREGVLTCGTVLNQSSVSRRPLLTENKYLGRVVLHWGPCRSTEKRRPQNHAGVCRPCRKRGREGNFPPSRRVRAFGSRAFHRSFPTISVFVAFRDSAVPVLFAVAGSIPIGINWYLALPYGLGVHSGVGGNNPEWCAGYDAYSTSTDYQHDSVAGGTGHPVGSAANVTCGPDVPRCCHDSVHPHARPGRLRLSDARGRDCWAALTRRRATRRRGGPIRPRRPVNGLGADKSPESPTTGPASPRR